MEVLNIHVKPQAKRDSVTRTGESAYEVSTTAAPLKGKANKQVVKLLAHFFNISPSKLLITKGERWDDKTIIKMD